MSAAYEASRACMNRFLAETDSDGWLHSCFHTAVNLFFPLPPHGTGRLVTLLAPERDLVPDSLILPADAFAAVQRLPAAGQVKKRGALIRWEGPSLAVSFGNVRTDNPKIPACRGEDIGRAAAQVKARLQKPHGLKRLPDRDCATRIRNLYRLAEYLRRGRTEEAVYWLAASAGAGPGLTPSSDDMIVGIIAALRSAGCRAPFPEPEDVYAALEGRTTEVGRHYICCALEGGISETMRNALRGDASAWDRLAETGATSGIDTITGLEIGVRVWIKQNRL